MELTIVKCQQFNVNDASYKIVDKYGEDGKEVKRHELLLSLDSSKATLDIESEAGGFFYCLWKVGDTVRVGETLYIISQSRMDKAIAFEQYFRQIRPEPVANEQNKDDKIITKSAKKLIIEHNVDIDTFSEEVITEEMVKAHLKSKAGPTPLVLEKSNFKKVRRIAFIGAGQGFVQALDIVLHGNELLPWGIYDDTPEKQGQAFFDIPVRGTVNFEKILDDYNQGLFDCIINTVSVSIDFRRNVFEALHSRGVEFANLVHPTAYFGFNNYMGKGNIVLAHVSAGPCTEIGNDNFISARCNIEHHNVMGNHCTFGPGVMTSGSVRIGNCVKFGTGIFIEPKVSISSGSVIASGCIINRNIDENVLVFDQGVKLSFKPLK